MKNTILSFIVLAILVTLTSCIKNNYTAIYFENKSDKFIDSAIIQVQNYKASLVSIKPNSTIKVDISKDSITHDAHDVLINVYLYTRDTSNFSGGTYYSDLGGGIGDSYTVSLNTNLNIGIKRK